MFDRALKQLRTELDIPAAVLREEVVAPKPKHEPMPTLDKKSEMPVEADLDEGMLVGIQGFLNLPALNGTVGILHGFDVASQRYMVQIDDFSVKKFKSCNLVIVEELDGVSDLSECDQVEQFASNSSGRFGLDKSYSGSSAAPSLP